MPEYETIQTEIRQAVGVIHLYRPRAANAINSVMLRELMAALQDLDTQADIGAMVITGDERIFSPGADVKEMAGATVIDMLVGDQIALFNHVRRVKKPLVAAVSGYCLGGGNELAMACDLVVASETARFGQPEVNLGVIPGAGGTQRLTRAVGKAIAMEMVLNNRILTAQEALQFGLVNRVVPVERCLDEAVALAGEIAARAPLAVRLAKEAINRAFETSLQEGLESERRLFYMLFASQDQKEGMAAFIEKRQPRWKGQ
jgi:enoyl-CoA hydratase